MILTYKLDLSRAVYQISSLSKVRALHTQCREGLLYILHYTQTDAQTAAAENIATPSGKSRTQKVAERPVKRNSLYSNILMSYLVITVFYSPQTLSMSLLCSPSVIPPRRIYKVICRILTVEKVKALFDHRPQRNK